MSDAPSQDAAKQAGLVYVSDAEPGIGRRRAGKGWSYRMPNGSAAVDAKTIARIRQLAIPPAYTDVWICPSARGHIQATGRDARGRKQYRYHEGFRQVRDGTKYAHMLEFAAALPAIRSAIDADLARPGLPREKVLATVVRLLETTMIRVGNADYAKTNGSFGLTTLRNRHVEVYGSELRFRFRGKSGKAWQLQVQDRRVARIVKAVQELPGQQLFQYLDAEGELREVGSADVNAYLRDISGQDITAKDFRTWTGTVLTAMALAVFEVAGNATTAKQNVRAAIASVAARLGNTPTVCRKCYIHPAILEGYFDGALILDASRDEQHSTPALSSEEVVVLAFLQRRLTPSK